MGNICNYLNNFVLQLECDTDAVNDGEVSPEEDSCPLPDIEILHNKQILYGKDITILEEDCSEMEQEIAIVRDKAAIMKKLLEEANEDSFQKPAVESTDKNTPLIEVVSEDSHTNVTSADTEFSNSSDDNSIIGKNSSIIFNCENLESLKFLNIDDDDTFENVICSDSEVESARSISWHEK